MGTPLAVWLINALVVIGLGLAVWLLVSIPFVWIKSALESAGVYAFPARVAAFAQRVGVDGSAIAQFFERANESMVRNGDQAMVRVVLDERHTELRNRLGSSETAIREAVGQVQGLAGHSGGTTFLADIAALKERTKLVDRLGVDLPPDLEENYAARRRLTGQLVILIPLLTVIALANGALLSVLFAEMTSMKVFGVLPLAYLLGVVVVLLEVGIGLAIHGFRSNPLMVGVVVLLILFATGFEAMAMKTFSIEFSTSLRDVDVSQATLQDYWMVLLAFVFTPMTSILGYMFEKTKSERDELSGRLQLSDELRKCNQFVDNLPTVWGNIDQKARSAEASIERLQDSIGGQGDRLAGTIDAVVDERRKLSAAILSARIEDWPNLVRGVESDARNAAGQNILLCIVTALAVASYAMAVGYLVQRASAGEWPVSASTAIGVVTALLFVVVGNLAFNRLRLTQGQDGRAQPMSAQPYHKAVALVLVVGAAAGLIWVATVGLGTWGAVVGIFLTALGGVLSFLGFAIERAARGLVLLAMITAGFVVAMLGAILSVLRYAVLWLLAALAWVLGIVVRLLALPAELILSALRNRGRPPASSVIEAQP